MILGLIVLITACTEVIVIPDGDSGEVVVGEPTYELKKFGSLSELKSYLKNSEVSGDGIDDFGGIGFGAGLRTTVAFAESADSSIGAPMAKSIESSAVDYSETNVQVKGVDEADIVKNDGKYIYMISDGKLVIVDAFPAEGAEKVAEFEVEGRARNLFVNGDRMVVFTDDNERVYTIPRFGIIPRERYNQVTKALIYDISDRELPTLVEEYSVSGWYYDSRMIEDQVYMITNDNVYYYGDVVSLPVVRESGNVVVKPDIFYFDNPETNYNFNTIASFNIKEENEINAETYMMGYGNTLFVSKDNIYIAHKKNLPYNYYRENNEQRFYEVVVPLLDSSIKAKINSIKGDNSLNSVEKWDKISVVIEGMYNNMEDEEKELFVDKMNDAIEEYEIKLEQERRKTIIHKISIDDGEIEYKARGEVKGHLLNQFSMDEHDGNLRVATTTFIFRRDSTMYNNVFVLDEDLDVIGELEDIAPDERIFSTRFMGDRLYMVTFKQIDPLFVIDLSNPRNPEILGELKIPGFSDYLHPYDENHIIGIGKDTTANEFGGVTTGGVKLALFDVSDVANPKEKAKFIIGTSGSDSEALRDHKAFLFDLEKNLLVMPVNEVKERVYDESRGYYRWNTWQGAYVFTLTEEGFEVKGTVTHSTEENSRRYYYRGLETLRRSLYMDNVLYTISEAKIKMNDLDTVEDINEVEISTEKTRGISSGVPLVEPEVLID